MKVFIHSDTVVKLVNIPPSKSYAQRAILAASLSKTPTKIIGIGTSKDVLNMLNIAKKLGATVVQKKDETTIIGGANPTQNQLNVGESGLGIRLVTAICASLNGNFELSGEGSLLKRSLTEFEQILPQIGVNCVTNKGFLPLKTIGNAVPSKLKINGSNSSQYLSGLLMSLPLLNGDSEVLVNNLNSKPYIDITIAVLNEFGIFIVHENYQNFIVKGNQTYSCKKSLTIEGDYSGASVWMVAGAIKAGIKLNGLLEHTAQGDQEMLSALKKANVTYFWKDSILNINKSDIIPFNFDATECPDLFPALVVLAASANGISELTGTNRLIHKESNRATVLKKEFNKLGLKIELNDNKMRVFGTGTLLSGQIDSNNDHRIAMAGAIAALLTSDGITITGSESVEKSYPDFWNNF